MTKYINKVKYTSSKNGKTNIYNFKDILMRNMADIEATSSSGAANEFYTQAHHGFGSDYSEETIKYESAAAAINKILPRWKFCN